MDSSSSSSSMESSEVENEMSTEESGEVLSEGETENGKALNQVCSLVCASIAMAACEDYGGCMMKTPLVDKGHQRLAFLDGIINNNDTECRNQLRMNRIAFYALRDKLRDSGRLCHTRGVTMEEQLAIFLHTLAHNVRNRVNKYIFSRPGETVSRHFKRVLNAVLSLYPDYIKGPGTNALDLMPERHRPYFKDCVGAIDGTHIPAMVPIDIRPRFRDRDKKVTQNVMAAVNFDMQFTYVLVGWEGSAADSRVLQDALTREDKLIVPSGKYYVVDAAYANVRGFLASYRDVQYHLKLFKTGSGPQNSTELFNYNHSSLRNIVERSFGLVKKRFPILKIAPPYSFQTQAKIVLACCILHNHIRSVDHDDSFFDDTNIDPLNDIDEDNEEEVEEEQRIVENRSRREREQWARMRDDLAECMWRDYTQ